MRKLYFFFCFFLILFPLRISAQNYTSKPKLVVGIVIDQMRYDYLYRFAERYGEGGFKRLLNGGFNCRNAHYNYVPTETAPGHASIYTGATPSMHGIIANNWFENGADMYCVQDTTVKTVGSETPNGMMSPKNLIATTITDQLKLATNQRSKVIAISIKDRGAILPAGHFADAAYWYDRMNGRFVSSSFYMKELPKWVQDFNNLKLPDKFLSQTWNTLLPIQNYSISTADDTPYEAPFQGKDKPTFPYNLAELSEKMRKSPMKVPPYDMLTCTPFGNTLVKEMALRALEFEKLGKTEGVTDFLAISFSSTDIVGHAFGTNSIELQDTYIRLDRDLAQLLEYFDKEVGEGNYLLFLTADHAATEVPNYLKDLGMTAGYISTKGIRQKIEDYLTQRYGEGRWILEMDDKQIYLNRHLINSKNLVLSEIQKQVAEITLQQEGIAYTFTATQLKEQYYGDGIGQFVQNGFFPKKSGDVIMVPQAHWLSDYWKKGTSHGTPYSYDTHIPLLFYGWQIKKGSTIERIYITDIAPTIATLLNIQFPSNCTGNPIEDLFD
ncbi:MAG: alkaline phosphatase family protein [Microscillaceae bacterium]|nr:alkaline phosphatase family protein [Microscillaceae bacterium]MDW8461712.1 alkaline phosphatase family protein [Cytophagales bacterium]